MLKNIHIKQLLLILSIALIFSIFCLHTRQIINKDGLYYIKIAKHVSLGEWSKAFSYRDFPFIPALIALTNHFIGNWGLSGQLVSFLSAILAIFVFYWLTNFLFNEKIALISSIFMALSPHLRSTSAIIAKDATFSLFLLLFLSFFYCSQKYNLYRYYILTFLSLVFASLCRVEGFLLLIVYILFLTYKGIKSKNKKIRNLTLIILAALTLLSALEFFSSFSHLGKVKRFEDIIKPLKNPVKFTKHILAVRIYKQLKEIEPTIKGGEFPRDLIEVTRNYIPVIYLLCVFDTFMKAAFPVMFFLGLIGIFFYKKSKEQKQLLFFMVFLLIPSYLFLLKENFLSKRYLASSSILLYCWTGVGFYCIWDWVKNKLKLPKNLWLVLLIILCTIPIGKIILHNRGNDSYILEAGKWLKKYPIKERIFLTNEPRLLYYAEVPYGRPIKKLLKEKKSLKTWLIKAKKYKAKMIVIESKKPNPIFGKPIKVFKGYKESVFIYKIANIKQKKTI